MRHAKLEQIIQPFNRRVKRSLTRKRSDMKFIDHSTFQQWCIPSSVAPLERGLVIQPRRSMDTIRLPQRTWIRILLRIAIEHERIIQAVPRSLDRYVPVPLLVGSTHRILGIAKRYCHSLRLRRPQRKLMHRYDHSPDRFAPTAPPENPSISSSPKSFHPLRPSQSDDSSTCIREASPPYPSTPRQASEPASAPPLPHHRPSGTQSHDRAWPHQPLSERTPPLHQNTPASPGAVEAPYEPSTSSAIPPPLESTLAPPRLRRSSASTPATAAAAPYSPPVGDYQDQRDSGPIAPFPDKGQALPAPYISAVSVSANSRGLHPVFFRQTAATPSQRAHSSTCIR